MLELQLVKKTPIPNILNEVNEGTHKGRRYIQSTILEEEGVIQGRNMKHASAKPCRRRNGQFTNC